MSEMHLENPKQIVQNERLVTDAGLQIVSAQQETEDEDGEPITFLWIVARKPELPISWRFRKKGNLR